MGGSILCKNAKFPPPPHTHKKNSLATHLFRPQYFGPYPKVQNLAPFFSILLSEVSKKLCHAPVGPKLREENIF